MPKQPNANDRIRAEAERLERRRAVVRESVRRHRERKRLAEAERQATEPAELES